jgi:methyl-accepting chemotaxis protein
MIKKFLQSLSVRIVAIVSIGIIVTLITGLVIEFQSIRKSIVHSMEEEMRAILNAAQSTTESIGNLAQAGAFDYEALSRELAEKGRENYRETTFFRTIPVVAAWDAIRQAITGTAIDFRVVRENPRNPENTPRTDLERRVLVEVSKTGVKEVFFTDGQAGLIAYAQPVVMSQSCMACHGNPATSPSGNGRDSLGFRMEGWKVGEHHGAYILTVPTSVVEKPAQEAMLRSITWTLPIGLIVLVGSSLVISRVVSKPVIDCARAVEKLAEGDLTGEVHIDRSDEIGLLAKSVNASISNLRAMVQEIHGTSESLNKSSGILSETANTQAAAAEQTNMQASTVASAGEQLATNARLMSQSAGEISQSSTSVATAVEEMSATIQEVARNCSEESEIARRADQQARQARELMSKLDESSRQIGKIVELINRIAEQTNLLALNATIEAASAGEAGRGFAVVANEVKELARQSAAATEDIRRQVTLMQENTANSMTAIDDVATVIEKVSHIAGSIAAAVEEQSATTSEIVRSLHSVTSATKTMSDNVRQTSSGAEEVSRNIHGVSQAAGESAQGSTRITSSAKELSGLAGSLGALVSKFKL